MFLQVIYLDSLELEGLSMPQTTFPRVRDFSFDRIRAMIIADKNFKRHISGDSDIEYGKLRKVDDCIYSWAVCKRQNENSPSAQCLHSIWESAIRFVQLLNIHIEAAGPLFFALAKFQDHVNFGVYVNGAEASRFLNVVGSLLIPYTRGLRDMPPYGNRDFDQGLTMFESPVSNGNSLLCFPICKNVEPGNEHDGGRRAEESSNSFVGRGIVFGHIPCNRNMGLVRCGAEYVAGSPSCTCTEAGCQGNINQFVDSTMSQFYSAIRRMKGANDIDLNALASCGAGSSTSSSALARDDCVVIPPWQLGYFWDYSATCSQGFFVEINRLQDQQSLAIVHRKPKYIQVSMDALVLQFSGKVEMELDMFDALVRVARQQDDILYSPFGTMRWRYFFESDVMFGILSGAFDLSDQRLSNNLCLSDVSYDISQAKIVFFQALLCSQWVCFAWLPQSNVIRVFDPLYCLNVPEGRMTLIERSCQMLKLALKTLSSSVFKGVCHDVSIAEMGITNLSDTSVSRVNSSGLLCSMFYRCFDGLNLFPNVGKVDVQGVAAKLFYEVRNLKENCGSLNCRV